ncbi:epoxyqueuosine reductase [Carboxylicivirga sediminis]|uniref:Epoxyqueuosine reductase n=1 Tax=Carboxylicivirga sediminis TaxID=2006564 RepID=A0A941IZG4_9BACT|nr:epoxyqueuosine reductase [Carboxylicivirga sediminis]MBR8537840.1 epoxyqueuosine reductase [Carboxylicivirga sediminis]
MPANNQITSFLNDKGASFIRFVNLQSLNSQQTQGYSSAILFGIALGAVYIKKVAKNTSYVAQMIKTKTVKQDEFHNTEIYTDKLADELSILLQEAGYSSFSQSEANLSKAGLYNSTTQTTPLPHKTLAVMAGLGWIGKNSLLITPEYGCAISMCSVLTSAPLNTGTFDLEPSQCGTCTICQKICCTRALKGRTWNTATKRDQLIDIHHCTTCLQCLVRCPYTKAYSMRHTSLKL